MDRLEASNTIWVYEWVLMGIVALICLVSAKHYQIMTINMLIPNTLHTIFFTFLSFVLSQDAIIMSYIMHRYNILCVSSTGRYYFVPNGTLLPFADVNGVRTERVNPVGNVSTVAATVGSAETVTDAMALEMGDDNNNNVRAF